MDKSDKIYEKAYPDLSSFKQKYFNKLLSIDCNPDRIFRAHIQMKFYADKFDKQRNGFFLTDREDGDADDSIFVNYDNVNAKFVRRDNQGRLVKATDTGFNNFILKFIGDNYFLPSPPEQLTQNLFEYGSNTNIFFVVCVIEFKVNRMYESVDSSGSGNALICLGEIVDNFVYFKERIERKNNGSLFVKEDIPHSTKFIRMSR